MGAAQADQAGMGSAHLPALHPAGRCGEKGGAVASAARPWDGGAVTCRIGGAGARQGTV